MDITQALAQFVTELTCDRIPEEVRHAARRGLIDTVGCAIAGSREDCTIIALALAREDAGNPRATAIFGSRETGAIKLPPADAAMVNAIAGHALDYDDVNAMGHPSVPVVFTALAAGEDTNATGREILEAYVAGVEIETRVNRGFSESHYLLGWHSTSTLGVLGAASAAAKLYRLDARRTAIAFGLAASQACGLRCNFGTMTKPYHPGHASWAGLNAARLARSGFTAATSVLDAQFGYYPVFSAGPYDAARVTGESGKWALLKPGLNVKKYPCCYCTHASIDGALALRQRFSIDPAAIKSVTVELSPFYLSPLIHHRPATGLEAKFSIEYTVAAALHDGTVSLRSFTDEMVRRPAVRSLLERVTSRSHNRGKGDGVQATFSRVTVELTDGSSLVEEIPEPRGAAANPMSDGEITEKFSDCWEFAGGKSGPESVLEMLWKVDRLDNLAALSAAIA
jgi:2-methylcitrate dehydratase PrpD